MESEVRPTGVQLKRKANYKVINFLGGLMLSLARPILAQLGFFKTLTACKSENNFVVSS